MKWFANNKWIPILVVILGIIIGLIKVLYAEQNKKIDAKADTGRVLEMIQSLKAIQVVKEQQYKEQRIEQKAKDEKQNYKDDQLQETLNQLNIQIILLNKELKKEKL